MATSNETQAHRSRVCDVAQEPLKMLLPIRRFDDVPLMTLEQAVEPLLSIMPDIKDYVYVAKQRCDEEPADGLTQDESVLLCFTLWNGHLDQNVSTIFSILFFDLKIDVN